MSTPSKAGLDKYGCPELYDGMQYYTHPSNLINGKPEDPPPCNPGGRA